METTDYISITALVVAIIGALGHFIETAHFKKIKIFGCLESECMGSSPITTPSSSTAILPPISSQGC